MPTTLLGSVLLDLAVGGGLALAGGWFATNALEDESTGQQILRYSARGIFWLVILYHIVARSVNSAIA